MDELVELIKVSLFLNIPFQTLKRSVLPLFRTFTKVHGHKLFKIAQDNDWPKIFSDAAAFDAVCEPTVGGEAEPEALPTAPGSSKRKARPKKETALQRLIQEHKEEFSHSLDNADPENVITDETQNRNLRLSHKRVEEL